jgi:hypothetical protein
VSDSPWPPITPGELADQGFHLHTPTQVHDLTADLTTLANALRDLTSRDPCQTDHHGHCQPHGWQCASPCPHGRARNLLAALDRTGSTPDAPASPPRATLAAQEGRGGGIGPTQAHRGAQGVSTCPQCGGPNVDTTTVADLAGHARCNRCGMDWTYAR